MFKMLCFAFVFLSLVASCLKKPAIPVPDVSSSDIPSLDVPSAVPADFSPEKYLFVKELSAKDKTVFFYQDHEGYTHYYNGKEDRIINREVMDKYKKMGGVPMHMSYGYDGKHLYFSQPVRWGPKKLIFIKLETDGKVVYTKELSALEEVLKPASIAFDGKGNMLLTWIDETPPSVNAAYMLVKGDSFSEKEDVISFDNDAILGVQPVYTDKGFAVIYVKTREKEIGEIKARFLSDGSEKVLYSGRVSNFDMSEEKGLFLIRLYHIALNIKLIVLNTSLDMIKEYTIDKPKELGEGFSLFDNGRLIEGYPFIIGAGSSPMAVNVEGYSLPQKPNIYYSYAGKGFERVVGGMPYMFTSTLGSFDSSEKYTLLAYMDRRFASPTVMAAVLDSGRKLIKRDIIIEMPGIDTGSPRVVNLGGDVFRVFYPVKDNVKKIWIYRSKDINAGSIDSLYAVPFSKDKMGMLTDSASKFADCRKKNDYGCIYDLLDPTYRAGISKGGHEDMMKRINATIEDFRFDNCKIFGDSVLAACDGYMKAKLPDTIMGKTIKEDERILEKEIKGDLWVFIGGQWYYLVDIPMLGYAHQW